MARTFTCTELGGVCDERFSGETFMEVMRKGSAHMMSDAAHTEAIMEMEKRTGETKEYWMARMQKAFDAKPPTV